MIVMVIFLVLFVAGVDLIGPTPSTLIFTAGQTMGDMQCADITIPDDSIPQPQRTFNVSIREDVRTASDGSDGVDDGDGGGGGGGSDGGGGGDGGDGSDGRRGGSDGSDVRITSDSPSISIDIRIDISDRK